MAITGADAKSEVLESLAEELRRQLPAAEAEGAVELLRGCYQPLEAGELIEHPSAQLVGAVRSLWRLGQERLPGETGLRVYNPESSTDGWSSPHTAIAMVNDDMPFLLASVTGELHRRERRLHQVLHPVLDVARDDEGRLQSLAAAEEGLRESWIHLEVDRETLGEKGLAELETSLRELLRQVRIAVEGWSPMKDRLNEVIDRLESRRPPGVDPDEVEESAAFLRWLLADHFTFLGARRYHLESRDGKDYLRLDPDSGLGLLREVTPDSLQRSATPLPEELSRFLHQREILILSKSSRRSLVHRPVHMDSVGVRRFDEEGQVVGEDRFLGLFTSRVYTSSSAQSIPLLRRKVRRIVERAAFTPGSHDAKALIHILESFPRDELFQISEHDLFDMALGILRLQQRPRVALFVRRDEFERFVSALVFVPRERYTFELRGRIQQLLEEAFGGQVTAFYTQMADTPLARTHFIIKTVPRKVPSYDRRRLERAMTEAARSWKEHLREHLVAQHGHEEGLALLGTFGEAFPVPYRERFPAKAALSDIAVMRRLLGAGERFEARFYQPPGTAADWVRLKLYQLGGHLSLSKALPVLENLGVRVESEIPFEVRPEGAEQGVWIHDFELRSEGGAAIPLAELGGELEETLRRVWSGELENGVLNRLVLSTGLQWRQVAVLRSYSRYLRQIGFTFSLRYMAQTLASNPRLARLLLALFDTLFDPDQREGFRNRAAAVLAEIRQAFEEVSSLDEDRILRGFLSVIKATLRTNYFQRDEAGRRKRHLAFKLDSKSIRGLPEPRPKVETFVYSPRVEGIHLRGGLVARGGLRWSDRREDFRTEILGLLKAQMVKNAVIVPVGAKGGFVVKRSPTRGGREALQREAVKCYRTFIRALLDLADNLDGEQVVPPPQVVRRDGDDPYMVVAADKGTATFSDIANELAAERGFWLGDAFASGGSKGYDHKKMGITARGAWEAVKRHFRELGRNIQKEPFTVVGVGDMAGDVFGNGMLLSRQTRLVGAFNHLHIFVDPDPDPATSFEERKRLFETPRSTWMDYDPGRISEGGGVFDRAAKHIPVSPRMATRFGLEGKRVTPQELIRALLTADVDLLWLGGIGTFVKAARERHADVGDRVNDAIRVDAGELRCTVVGEGANLGFTQPGRIEYALAGGRINTDAIDNSGGVDTSDHEVNIKIALGTAVREGHLTGEERDRLLDEMTEEVAALVLRDNYLQTQAISLTEIRGTELLEEQSRMVRTLERAGRLDRRLEGLPDEEELAERSTQRRGLTRPELAVLLAYGKIFLYDELLVTDLPDDPLLEGDLLRYFPEPMRISFRPQLERHRLRREIIATYITNSMVNRVGPSFVFRLMEASGRPVADVARAYTVTRDAFDLRKIWSAVEALDNRATARLQLAMLLEAARLIEHATLWFLRRFDVREVSRLVSVYRGPLRQLSKGLEPLLSGTARRELRRRARDYTRDGVGEKLALQVAGLRDLAAGVDIVRLAVESDAEVERVAKIYFAVGERFGLDWLRAATSRLEIQTPWQQSAVENLRDDLFHHQSNLTRQVILGDREGHWRRAIDLWAERRAAAVVRTQRLVEELRGAGRVDLAMLTVAEHQVMLTVAEHQIQLSSEG
jgi:glutamate dehydrogenase